MDNGNAAIISPSEKLARTAEKLFSDAAAELADLLDKIASGKGDKSKLAALVKVVREAFWECLEQRTKVEEHLKKQGGIVNAYAIDFDAARAEIGFRLACLRDAGEGG